MKSNFFVIKNYVILFFLLVSCSAPEVKYKRSASGMEYKIYRTGAKRKKAGSGDVVKLNQYWYWKDTLRYSDKDSMPHYQALIPGLIFPYHPFEALIHGVREGDSVVVRMRIDSLLSQKKLEKMPEGAKEDDAWVVGMKVLKIFPFDPLGGDSVLHADKLKESKRKMKIGEGEVSIKNSERITD